MKYWIVGLLSIFMAAYSIAVLAEDGAAGEIKRAIQEHYSYINSADYDGAGVHH